VIGSGVDHEFRTTAYPGALSLEELPAVAAALSGGRLYALQQFRPGETLDPAASAVTPYGREELKRAAAQCSTWLPTIVRGLG
jgi:pyruvate formate lyase activating enzyme